MCLPATFSRTRSSSKWKKIFILCRKHWIFRVFIQYNKISKSPEKIRALVDMPVCKRIRTSASLRDDNVYACLPNLSSLFSLWKFCVNSDGINLINVKIKLIFIKLKSEVANDRNHISISFRNYRLYWLVTLPQMVLLAYCYIWIARAITFASRSLTDVERNCSQLDREAFVIIRCTKKFWALDLIQLK